MQCFGGRTVTIDLRLSSNLSFGRTQGRLVSLRDLEVNEVEEKGRLVIRFMEGFRSSIEIWRLGSIVVHVQPREDIRKFLQPVLDALVDSQGRPASVSLETFQAKGWTGTHLLQANVEYDWMGTTDGDRRRYDEILSWARDTCELALVALGKSMSSTAGAVEQEIPIEV